MTVAEISSKFKGKVFAPSLEGTEIDRRLCADISGNLILDLEVRDLFDYFLNAVASAIQYRGNQCLFEVQYYLYQNDREILLNSGLSGLDQEKEIEHFRQKYFSDEQFLAQAKVKGLRS